MAIREVDKRPLRGGIWGLVFGLGLALLLIAYNVIALGTLMPYIVIVLGIALGVVWGWLGPPKEREEPVTVVDHGEADEPTPS